MPLLSTTGRAEVTWTGKHSSVAQLAGNIIFYMKMFVSLEASKQQLDTRWYLPCGDGGDQKQS